ncbi:hypothetical protein IFM89_033156 [Coptis chinensis]|uniref:Uncharacterized protein n=1 Tax=Coptis chinensis TaxID=261450 RepID=A0A835MAV6_9MAGN|nr:hypothetical protein IFM89_033156 [Coptis chinensis]
MGVNVSGTIALARYGQIYRGDIVRNAYEAGAVGAVVYTDKKDFGGNKEFPNDKWMPSSGVQVGSVFCGAGDPTTPGWASSGDCERLSYDDVEKSGDVPLIPSLPISGGDGDVILRSLGGQVANDDWQDCDDSPVYRVGPGPGILNLTYLGSEVINTIQNVIAVIEGVDEPDRFVILGNHRDAWTFGAVDPNSGTASLLEVAQRLGKLQKKGWRPRRTIILCNWDAEEYGLIGSTEWVEENREMLASKVVAYLNVDCGVSGAGFHASATPQLDELLIPASQLVQDPDNSSQTIYESWISSSGSPSIGRLGGGGSDYAPFIQHVGIPSADMHFGGAASIWGLVALQLADSEVLPFNYLTYAYELQISTKILDNEVLEKGIDFTPMYKSIEELTKSAGKVNSQMKVYAPAKHDDYGSKSFPGIDDAIEVAKSLNTKDAWVLVQHEVWRASRAIRHASLVLNGQLT